MNPGEHFVLDLHLGSLRRRWMGALANTRWYVHFVYVPVKLTTGAVYSLGDLRFKKFGVTPEPEVRTKLLEGIQIGIVLELAG